MRRGLSTTFTLLLTGTFAGAVAAQPTRLGAELQVNSYTPGAQALPAIAVDPEGDFLVVWYSAAQHGEERVVFGRRFSSAGTALANEFQVNKVTQHLQYNAD